MRQKLIQAVEAAIGWQFVPSHALVKVPGFTEPSKIMAMTTVVKNALAAQLVAQIDASEFYTFSQNENGRAVVTNNSPKVKDPDRTSAHDGNSRSVNTINAIYGSGFIGMVV